MANRTYHSLFVLCLMLHAITDAKVSNTACTNEGTECAAIPNSACVNSKCQCVTDFAENTENRSTCVKAVSATTCSAQGTECNAIANSACETTKCKCDTGFTEMANTCVKLLGATCTEPTDCVANAICEETCKCKPLFKPDSNFCVKRAVSEIVCSASITCTIPNSECNTDKCRCKAGYKENPNDLSSCAKLLGSSCSGADSCNSVTNAVCDIDKCACGTNYIEDNDVCRKKLGQTCTNEIECVSNAECAETMCSCKAGFEVTNGLCAKPSSSPKSSIAKLVLCGSMLMSIFIYLL